MSATTASASTPASSAAQSRGYEGCEYWAVDLDNAVVADQGAASAQQFSVVLSNASLVNARVDVEIFCTEQDAMNPAIGCTVGEFAKVEVGHRITPGGLAIVDLDPRELDGSSSAPISTTVRAPFDRCTPTASRSIAPLIAYQFNPLENVNVFSNDACLLLPTSALDDRYLVLGWPQTLALTEDPLTNGTIDLQSISYHRRHRGRHPTVVIHLSTDILRRRRYSRRRGRRMSSCSTLRRGEVINLETDGFQRRLHRYRTALQRRRQAHRGLCRQRGLGLALLRHLSRAQLLRRSPRAAGLSRAHLRQDLHRR